MVLDSIDLSIIKELQKNGRSSNREVGRVLGISEGTVRQHLKKLEAAKAMRLGLVTDAVASGLTLAAFVRIKAQPRQAPTIAKKVADFPQCAFVGMTVGRFDLIALLNVGSREDLVRIIDSEIATMKGVLQLDVREPVAYAKHRFDLVHIP
ncbi:MAG TPA: Lrp/AsnC family transcriptional regulator [Caulobacteraceae bacterium]|jgi:Lrp/AsnC family transcriptional regulator for asnA, asnC and gidA